LANEFVYKVYLLQEESIRRHNGNDESETTTTPSAGIDEISDEDLEQSLKSMKNRKAAGPDGLNSELFKIWGDPPSQTAYLS